MRTEDEKKDWAHMMARYILVDMEDYDRQSLVNPEDHIPWTLEEKLWKAARTLREEALPVKMGPLRRVLEQARTALSHATDDLNELLEIPDE